MPAPVLHPLDARFLRLALVQQLLSPAQAKQAEESLQRRFTRGQPVTIEQVLQEEGYLTDAECQSLWDLIAQATDTRAREQISKRRESIDVPTSEAPAIPTDIGHLPDLGEAYQILGLIGRGGMGTVFRARQLNMDREVALKVLRADLTANARYIRRFIREARAAGQLDHPNLVRVYDVGEAGTGGWFMAMEYVEGRTVRHLLRREGRLNLVDSLRILEQVTAALECAHRNKIVHRDIKPDNIMITSRGVAKLCDLGLAKALEGPLQDTDTQEGSTLGTPHYMSPEQAQGLPLDERSDLFSLGATLYHMVTGRVPFEGASALEIMLKVSTQDPVPPEQIEPLLPSPVCKLIHRLMARVPQDRPESAAAVRRELEELCRDLASGRIFAYEDRLLLTPVSRRAFKAADRRWLAGLAAAVVFVMLCVALRTVRGDPRVPPVEPPILVGASPETSSKQVPANPDNDPDGKAPDRKTAGTDKTGREPLKPDAALVNLEKQLAQPNADWPALETELERWTQAHQLVSEQDQPRVAALRMRLAAWKTEAAEREWAARWPAAQAFARARQFSTADRVLDGIPAHLVPALKEILPAGRQRLEQDRQDWTTATRNHIRSLVGMGHLRIAGAWLTSIAVLLDADRAPLNDPRRAVLKELAEALAQNAAAQEKDSASSAAARTRMQQQLVAIRQASSKHDLAGALALCEKALAAAQDVRETAALKTEQERLMRVQRLFETMAETLKNNKRRISEKDFRPNETRPGLVIGMTERHLVVQVPNAGRPDSEANIPLSSISRTEMRALIDQVFSVRRLAADDPIGRMAYDLEENAAEARVQLYGALSHGDPSDRGWLATLMQSEAFQRQERGENLLDEAEQLYLKGRFVEALRTLAQAREVLFHIQDAGVNARLQDLLDIVSEAETQSRVLGGTWLAPIARLDVSAVELAECWTWKPGAPTIHESVLTFGTEELRAESPWKVWGSVRVECDLSVPAGTRGTISLALGGEDAKWCVYLDVEGDAARIAFEPPGHGVPAWTTVRVTDLQERVCLWMKSDGQRLQWGLDDRSLGGYLIEPRGEWTAGLRGQGGLQIAGLRVLGTVESDGKARGNPGAALLQGALAKPVGSRLRVLREVLASPLLSLAERAETYAAIADENRTLGLRADAHTWTALALYACPLAQLPAGVRAREADHVRRQEEMERNGQTPLQISVR